MSEEDNYNDFDNEAMNNEVEEAIGEEAMNDEAMNNEEIEKDEEEPFNAEKQGDSLHNAITVKEGTSEIISIITSLTNEQRQLVKEYYITAYGVSLEKELQKKLSGNIEECILALLEKPIIYDTDQLFKAIDGAGTNEDTLNEIITTRHKWQIEEIK